ncbi:MAG: hypothetical protein Q4G59_07335 [Planctomycetia bacterium]|nr:hypothetical protein [Planctomycetia bacterium]
MELIQQIPLFSTVVAPGDNRPDDFGTLPEYMSWRQKIFVDSENERAYPEFSPIEPEVQEVLFPIPKQNVLEYISWGEVVAFINDDFDNDDDDDLDSDDFDDDFDEDFEELPDDEFEDYPDPYRDDDYEEIEEDELPPDDDIDALEFDDLDTDENTFVEGDDEENEDDDM